MKSPFSSTNKKMLRAGVGVGVGMVVLGVIIVTVLVIIVSSLLERQHLSSLVNTDLSSAQLASRAQEQTQNGDFAAAEISLQEALVKEAKLEYQSQLALVQYRQRKYSEAIESYQAALNNGASAAFIWNGIGNCYRDWSGEALDMREKYQQDALDSYRKSREADAGYVAAYTNAALFLRDLGRKDEANDLIDQAYSSTGKSELLELKN